MAYTKTTWIDRLVQFPRRFAKSNETSTSVTLTADPGTVTQAGTALAAANLNKMEQGIYDAHVTADAALPAASYTAADILAKLKTVDGEGSGLDADLLDGQSSRGFLGMPAAFPSGTDFNDWTTQGTYHGVFASALTNEPLAGGTNARRLTLVVEVSGGWIVQTLYYENGFSEGQVFKRNKDGTQPWQTWYKVWNANNSGPGSGMNADMVDGFHKADILGGKDTPSNNLDNATVAGTYFFADTTSNSPWPGLFGIVDVLVSQGDTYNGVDNWVFQRARNTSNPSQMMQRHKINNGAWSAWVGVGGVKSVQRGSTIVGSNEGGTTKNVTISSIDINKSWVHLNEMPAGLTTPVRARLTSGTNLEIAYNGSSYQVWWEIVESY